jgi:NarL family two-component system response regulator LiaR
MKALRILVVDDHPLMRQAICTAIESERDMEVAGEATDGNEAIAQALKLHPDVIVMDLLMPGKDGLEAIVEIRAANPEARILALTSSSDDDLVVAAIEAGVQGYLLKDTPRDQLLEAIREVHAGNGFLPPAVARKLMDRMRAVHSIKEPSEPLTERELQVLRLIGQGASNREIAEALRLSEATVRVHVHNLLGKLGLEHRGQAMVYILRNKV